MILKIFTYPRYVFIALVISFIVFNVIIYAMPEYSDKKSADIAAGKMVWQQNNCHTCHQLYGLGGYLGPDLTNVVAKPGATAYIKAVIQNGMFQMPAFDLTEKEVNDLLLFLEAANQAGSANPTDYETTYYGTFTTKNQ